MADSKLDNADRKRALLVRAIAQAAAQEANGLRDIYRMTHAKLEAVCRSVGLDHENAREALQDCYLAVWRNASRFDASRASPITWLARIAHNKAIDRIRRKDGSSNLGCSTVAVDPVDPAWNPEQLASAVQERAFAQTCLSNLEYAQAALIRAIYVEGLTYPQLAAQMGLPVQTVKSKVRRTILLLRAELKMQMDLAD